MSAGPYDIIADEIATLSDPGVRATCESALRLLGEVRRELLDAIASATEGNADAATSQATRLATIERALQVAAEECDRVRYL